MAGGSVLGRARHDYAWRSQRSRAAGLAEIEQRDAELAGLVGEVVGDAGAGEDDDADRQAFEQVVVALERHRLGVPRPVRLEDDLWDFARVRLALMLFTNGAGLEFANRVSAGFASVAKREAAYFECRIVISWKSSTP